MNEQLQQALSDLINKTVSGIDAGSAFLQSEIPEVITQLLMWKMCEALIVATMYLVILLVSCRVISKNVGMGLEDQNNSRHKLTLTHDEDGEIAPWIMFTWTTALIPFFSGLEIVSAIKDAIQIWVAPKIYLIEYAASLAR
jgi:hypothetical protein